MFNGGWSTGSTSDGGGGWSTGSAPSGSGWLGGAPSGGGWLGGSTTQTTTGGGSYGTSNYGSGYYGYQSPAYPGAGLSFGPYGEGGPYTPLDFPLMHELRPGERLEDLDPRSGKTNSLLPCLALGVLALWLLKGK